MPIPKEDKTSSDATNKAPEGAPSCYGKKKDVRKCHICHFHRTCGKK